jgi:NAD-dependent SIR2 family protein deacetylase
MTARELISVLQCLSEEKKDLRVFTENLDYSDGKAEVKSVVITSHYDHPDEYDVVYLEQS